MLAIGTYCCVTPNPALQLFYLSILGGCYFTLAFTSFQYISGLYTSAYHRYTDPAAASVGLYLFLLTSFTDAGTIDESTVKSHLEVYTFDGILYEEKPCPTWNISWPARSKHCSICNKCVARFDHHCAWMNNCIGEGNLRHFLSFLGWHVLLCWYGVWVLTMILAGQIEEQGLVRAIRWYIGRPAIFPYAVQWLLVYYLTQVMLVISLLLFGFFGYHVSLGAYNTTTNEKYKWDRLRHWCEFYPLVYEPCQKSSSDLKDPAPRGSPIGRPEDKEGSAESRQGPPVKGAQSGGASPGRLLVENPILPSEFLQIGASHKGGGVESQGLKLARGLYQEDRRDQPESSSHGDIKAMERISHWGFSHRSSSTPVWSSSTSGEASEPSPVYKPTDSIFEDVVKKYTRENVLQMKNSSSSRQLGNGGFGTVYLGKLENGKEVAVKILDRSSQQGMPEFLNEVHLLKR